MKLSLKFHTIPLPHPYYLVGAPTVEVAACASQHGEQRLYNGKVGISRCAVYVVTLADLGYEFAVGAVGIGDEPIIHFAHTKYRYPQVLADNGRAVRLRWDMT